MEKTTFNLIVMGTLLTIVVMFSFVTIYRPNSIDSTRPAAAAPASDTAATNSSGHYPGFTLPDLGGKMISTADYRGKVVLINFWATWCGPCRQEIPDFIELYKQYQPQGFEILGVSMDAQGAPVVTPYVQSAGITYPVLIGNADVSRLYEVTALPTTIVLDRKGKMSNRLVGAQNRETVEALVKSLL